MRTACYGSAGAGIDPTRIDLLLLLCRAHQPVVAHRRFEAFLIHAAMFALRGVALLWHALDVVQLERDGRCQFHVASVECRS